MSKATGTWAWFDAALPPGFDSGALRSVASDGETWLAFGASWSRSSPSTTQRASFAVSTYPDDEWEMRLLTLDDHELFINDVTYADGRWVGVGGYRSDDLLVITSENPEGPWDEQELLSLHGVRVLYGDATWFVLGRTGRVFTATDPAGTWTQVTTFEDANRTSFNAGYHDGTWVVAFSRRTSPYAVEVWSATDPAGTWTSRGSFTTGRGGIEEVGAIGYGDGVWYVRTRTETWTKAALPDASWTQSIASTGDYLLSYNMPGGLLYADGVWVALGRALTSATSYFLKTATSVSGTFTSVEIDVEDADDGVLYGPVFDGTDWVIVGARENGSPGVLTPGSASGGAGWGMIL